jgi:hypothetical protein
MRAAVNVRATYQVLTIGLTFQTAYREENGFVFYCQSHAIQIRNIHPRAAEHAELTKSGKNMRTRAIKFGALILVIASIVTMTPLSGNTATEQRKARPDIPRIANLSVGYDTMLTAQGLYGAGMPETGGHYKGALIWRSRQTGWYLYADGFDLQLVDNKWTEVIDQITLSESSYFATRSKIPYTSLPTRYCVLTGGFKLGMEEATALRLARIEGIKPQILGKTMSWSKPGYVRVDEYTTYNSWTVELRFDSQRKLDAIWIYCE